jgi:hypothetical protein
VQPQLVQVPITQVAAVVVLILQVQVELVAVEQDLSLQAHLTAQQELQILVVAAVVELLVATFLVVVEPVVLVL